MAGQKRDHHEGECLALAFVRKSKTLAAFDRYERRATSRRNRRSETAVSLAATLKLRYRSKSTHLPPPTRRHLPPRPKYMRRETYRSLCNDINEELVRMYSAHLGQPALRLGRRPRRA
jgi:hypothetical protein